MIPICRYYEIIVVQWLSCVWVCVTPWTAAHQASLSTTISQSLFKFMSTESVMLSNHLLHQLISHCCNFFLMMRTFKIYSQQLSDIQYSSIYNSHHTIHLHDIYIVTGGLYFLTLLTYFIYPHPCLWATKACSVSHVLYYSKSTLKLSIMVLSH